MASDAHAAETHASPLGPRQYIIIGAILTVITAVELWASYADETLGSALVPILIVLSAVKFAIVVALFMHLRFEARIFTQMFMFGLLLGGAILIALISLFWNDPSDAVGGDYEGDPEHHAALLLDEPLEPLETL